MGTYQAPTKEQVRQYLKRRFASSGPLPSPSEIRHELGWVECPQRENSSGFGKDEVAERENSAM